MGHSLSSVWLTLLLRCNHHEQACAVLGGRGFGLVWIVIPTVQQMLGLELTDFCAVSVPTKHSSM